MLALMIVSVSFSQNRAFIINESFDSPNMPEGWYFTGEGAENFKVTTTNNAGGDPNELFFKSSPYITSGIHLVMGSADLTGVSQLGLSFKHYLFNDQQSSTIGIATSSDNGTTWNTAWSKTYSESTSTGQYSINETVSTSDMGKENVLFCLFFEGNTYNFNKWYFDDISIFTQGSGADIQLLSIDVNSTIQSGKTPISFTISNTGQEKITSFKASYQINEETIVEEEFSTNLEPSNNQQFTFKKKADLLAGTYSLEIKILSVNGKDDSDESNNVMSKDFKTFIKSIERTPMIEHFSSSTCQPCVSVDNDMTTLTENNEGKYTYVKYPWNYPGIGDKYYIEDCGIRGNYYGVTGVPSIIFDGTTTTKEPEQSNFDNSYATPAYVKITGGYEIDNKNITVKASINPYIDIEDAKLFMTVNEKTTTGNIGSNGLKEFHHVLMCMVTGSEGLDTSFYAGKKQEYEFVYDMSSTNVEEMEDLEVAVWIQSYDTKEVHNSAVLTEGFKEDDEDNITETETSSVKIYPNPVKDNIFISCNESIDEITVYNVLGVIVYKENDFSGNNIDVSDLNDGIYFIQIKTDNNHIIKQFIKQ